MLNDNPINREGLAPERPLSTTVVQQYEQSDDFDYELLSRCLHEEMIREAEHDRVNQGRFNIAVTISPSWLAVARKRHTAYLSEDEQYSELQLMRDRLTAHLIRVGVPYTERFWVESFEKGGLHAHGYIEVARVLSIKNLCRSLSSAVHKEYGTSGLRHSILCQSKECDRGYLKYASKNGWELRH